MSVTEAVIERVQSLTPEQQRRVLEFVEIIEQEGKPRRSLSEVMNKIVGETFGQVPEEELRKLPTDASQNLDHYLYGATKK